MQTLTLAGQTIKVRAFEKIVYVARLVDTTYQVLNIYIPEEYFSGQSRHGYTAATAPIFFPNQIGGYMPGLPTVDKQHFTPFSAANSTVAAPAANAQVVRLMNPLYYLGKPGTGAAQHWRLRHGTKDKDTGLAIPLILGTTLQNKGYDVDLALPWDRPHSGDYDLDQLFAWVAEVCK